MTITKILQLNPFDPNPTWVLYSDIYPRGIPCNPSFFLPMLQAQAVNRFWAFLTKSNNGQYAIQFDTNAPNVAVVTMADGDSVSNNLPWEYVYETTDGNNNPLPRLVNDNQALHGYDNGNSGVNLFSLPVTAGQSFGEIKKYSFVIAKRQTTFADDWDVSFAGVLNDGTSTFSAIVNPNNAGEWLVTCDLKEVFVDTTPYLDPIPANPAALSSTNFLSVCLVKLVTHV